MTTTQIGKLAVRRSIEIDATTERVWKEFERAERLRLWYTPAGGAQLDCKRLEYESRVGGVFETEGYHEWQGGHQMFAFKGHVLAFDPGRELTVEMQREGLPAMLLSFLLTPLEGGRTKVEIVQHGFQRFGEGAENVRNAFEHGWNMDVPNALRSLVETGMATGWTTLQVIHVLYDYHRWANERLLDAEAKVAESELLRDAEIPFGGVRTNMLYILGSQVSWIIRLTGTTPELAKLKRGSVVSGLRHSFGSAHVSFARYLDSLTDEEVERETPFIEFEGGEALQPGAALWEVLLGVGSHGMTDSSEVGVILTHLGASPEQMDYSEYAWRHDLRDGMLAQKGLRQS